MLLRLLPLAPVLVTVLVLACRAPPFWSEGTRSDQSCKDRWGSTCSPDPRRWAFEGTQRMAANTGTVHRGATSQLRDTAPSLCGGRPHGNSCGCGCWRFGWWVVVRRRRAPSCTRESNTAPWGPRERRRRALLADLKAAGRGKEAGTDMSSGSLVPRRSNVTSGPRLAGCLA